LITDEELLLKVTEMEERMGPLPSPEHEPLRFKHFVKLFTYYKNRDKENEQSTTATAQDS
jgi:hypothetical protein